MAEFAEPFDKFVCDGSSITCTVDGIEFRAEVVTDSDFGIDDDDIHNTDRSVTGCSEEQHKKLMAAREAWKRDEWFYCGIVISARHVKTDTYWDHLDSLWGIEANYPESDNSYLKDVANEMLPGAVKKVRAKIRKLCAVIS